MEVNKKLYGTTKIGQLKFAVFQSSDSVVNHVEALRSIYGKGFVAIQGYICSVVEGFVTSDYTLKDFIRRTKLVEI